MKKIGLIGLGEIGSYYADKLLGAGFPLTVYNRTVKKMEKAVEKGAKAAYNPEKVIEESDILVLSLLNSEVVTEIVTEHLVPVLREGQIVINTSTCSPKTEAMCERMCAEKNAGYLDSPLTRRKQGHILMVGGEKRWYEEAVEVLDTLAYRHYYLGKIGNGQILKAVNQAYLADMWAYQAELLEFLSRIGMEPAWLRDILEFPIEENMLKKDYAGKNNLAMHYKDLGYFQEIAHDNLANVPITSLSHEIFKATMLGGDPSWAQVGIRTYYERLHKKRN